MKNRYIILKLIILISMVNSLNAQKLSIGVAGDIGFNKISNIEDAIIGLDLDPSTGYTNTTLRIIDYEEKNFVLSGNLGFFVEKNIGNKSSIILKCLWMQIKGEGIYTQSSSTSGINGGLGNYEVAGQPYGVIGDSTNLNNNTQNFYRSPNSKEIRLNYIAMSIMYRYKVNNLGITGGILPMFGLSGRGNDSRKNSVTIETEEYEIKDVTKVDLGMKVGFDYKVANNIRMVVSYYQGFRNIRKLEFHKNKSRNRQISLGMEYMFWKNKKSSEEGAKGH